MAWEGLNAVSEGRKLLGATHPKDSLPGTIRGDLCVDIGRNICHGSDSNDSAKHEIEFWFEEGETQQYTSTAHNWVYEKGAPVKTGGAGGDKKAAKKDKKAAKKKDAKKAETTEGGLDAKRAKACLKEGGKKGQDLGGMSTFGVQFFLTAMDEPKGEMEYLQLCMDGANKEVDPDAEDRKGGAGDLGKIFLSAGDTNLSIICHVPKECQDKVTVEEWFAAILKDLPPCKITKIDEHFSKTEIPANPDANQFPLKLRDVAIGSGFQFLREKGLVMDDDSGDDINFADECGIDLNAGAEGDY